MIRTFDWDGMVKTIRERVMDITGLDGLHVIEEYQSGKKPSFPFIVVNPKGNVIRDWWAHSPNHEPFETYVSVTVHSNLKMQALHISDDIQAILRDPEVHYELSQDGITVVDVLDPSSRTVLITVSSEYEYGFDLQLRLQRNFDSELPTFDDYNNPNGQVNK